MKRFLLPVILLISVMVIVAFASESDTEDQAIGSHSMTVSTNIEGGSLIWTNSLNEPARLQSMAWKLPASTVNTVTVDHVDVRVAITKNSILTTNSYYTPAIVNTNWYSTEVVTLVTNTLYSGATTNSESIILDAGINGDIPEYYYIMGKDRLQMTFSDTNSIPIRWSLRK